MSTTSVSSSLPEPKHQLAEPQFPNPPNSRYHIPRLSRGLHTSLIATYNCLSELFTRSDTKQTLKRFRDQMRRPWTREKDALPLCPDCGAMTFAEWEKRSCLSSFEIHRHQKQTLPEKAGTHDV